MCRGLSCVQWFEARGGFSFCWYWWNCWPALFKHSFHNDICKAIMFLFFSKKKHDCLAYQRIQKMPQNLHTKKVNNKWSNEQKIKNYMKFYSILMYIIHICNKKYFKIIKVSIMISVIMSVQLPSLGLYSYLIREDYPLVQILKIEQKKHSNKKKNKKHHTNILLHGYC